MPQINQELFWPLYACVVAALALIPLWVYLCRAIKKVGNDEKRAFLEMLSQKEKTLQEFAYNAIGYAVEQRGKAKKQGNEIDVKTVAIKHIQRRMEITETEAQDAIESILGKVSGEGASGKERVIR